MKKAKQLFTLAIILMVALFAKADENWETLNNKMPAQIIALKLLAYGLGLYCQRHKTASRERLVDKIG